MEVKLREALALSDGERLGAVQRDPRGHHLRDHRARRCWFRPVLRRLRGEPDTPAREREKSDERLMTIVVGYHPEPVRSGRPGRRHLRGQAARPASWWSSTRPRAMPGWTPTSPARSRSPSWKPSWPALEAGHEVRQTDGPDIADQILEVVRETDASPARDRHPAPKRRRQDVHGQHRADAAPRLSLPGPRRQGRCSRLGAQPVGGWVSSCARRVSTSPRTKPSTIRSSRTLNHAIPWYSTRLPVGAVPEDSAPVGAGVGEPRDRLVAVDEYVVDLVVEVGKRSADVRDVLRNSSSSGRSTARGTPEGE